MATVVDRPLEGDATDLARYEIHSRLEIVSLLHSIALARVAVSVYFNQGAEFIVTNLLAVNPEFEELILDLGADEETNDRLLRAERMTVVAFLDHIRLQFQSQRVERTVHDRLPALRMRLPDVLMRLQRRNDYRIRTSLAKPITASFSDPARPERRLSLRILNLSCGGVALIAGAGEPELAPGAVLENCRIDLPEVGVLTTTLAVQDAGVHREGVRMNLRRYGCRFVNLPPGMPSAIQRYITKLERERARRL
jgi:c-di-GMP-binding flagellar brake protein YcgR